MKMKTIAVIVSALTLGSTAPSPPTASLITVDKNVKLEVLDWGGSGRPLVLLAGLGDTAHVFDDFAPKLTTTCHVYGIRDADSETRLPLPPQQRTTLLIDSATMYWRSVNRSSSTDLFWWDIPSQVKS